VNAWYWDINDSSRAWAKRFEERHPKHDMPNQHQAGVYSGTLHYLKAVDKLGSAEDGKAVVAAMKAIPIDDSLFGKGQIREDGRAVHAMYLLQVKAPAQSKGKWDVFNVLATIPGEEAFRPLAEGGCPLVKP
jgi:branched-chain amino acid transport system substrate-binding protein